jgi:hypothetical protein
MCIMKNYQLARRLIQLMWAIAVVPKRLITVVAKSAETFRVAVLSQPIVKIATATQLLSLPVAAAVDVVNAEELVSRLAATSACFAVVLDSCGSQPLMPFTSCGMAPLPCGDGTSASPMPCAFLSSWSRPCASGNTFENIP